jgi:hypothetical protein
MAKKKAGLVVVQLDVSKAFDMVPHQAIKDAISRNGIPEYIVKLNRDPYEDVATKIKHGTIEMSLQTRQGVKQQGDPLPLQI